MGFPTESFQDYDIGGLNTLNGGSGWSAPWGSAVTCGVAYGVVSSPVFSGTRGGDILQEAPGAGYRAFNSVSDTTSIFQMYVRQETGGVQPQTQVNLNSANNDTGTSYVTAFQFNTGSDQIQVRDNATWVNLSAFSRDTWYKVNERISSFAGKTYRINFCNATADPACSPSLATDYTFYSNNTATELLALGFIQANGCGGCGIDFYVDDISDAAPVTATARGFSFPLLGVGQ